MIVNTEQLIHLCELTHAENILLTTSAGLIRHLSCRQDYGGDGHSNGHAKYLYDRDAGPQNPNAGDKGPACLPLAKDESWPVLSLLLY